MKFIDLFAGLGGFHLALSKLGHSCVFASEIKSSLVSTYTDNFGIKPAGDIRQISEMEIPDHDILCAGFPCQPFSKAGRQKGLSDENNGNLFNEIVRILRYHRPKYFILENVQHLAKHDNAVTYNFMSNILTNELGYDIRGTVLSPHEFNIPQHRQRLFIVGSSVGLDEIEWPEKVTLEHNVRDFLRPMEADSLPLEPEKIKCLDVWQHFLDVLPISEKLPSFPIWAMEFGATYPFEETTPFSASDAYLSSFSGSFGMPLSNLSREAMLKCLPSYARAEQTKFPRWKINYIRQNRDFYEKYKEVLLPVVEEIKDLGVSSWQKLEWNVQGGNRVIRDYLIQFRGSGIRLKKADFFPSLVCVSTQIPIIGWQERYISRFEGAKLQGMESLPHLPWNNGTCFDALGNAVNSTIVLKIAEKLIGESRDDHTHSGVPRHKEEFV